VSRIPRNLSEEEVRVLGSLLEKEQTTPELYPLSVNAIVQAANQKTAREPVMSLSEGAVHGALRDLLQAGLVQRTEGARVTRWRHELTTLWDLDAGGKAVLTLLLLRGPQTPGELRGRSERMHAFASGADLDEVLVGLSAGSEPLARELPRMPGQKETRWSHTLGGSAPEPSLSPAVRRYASEEDEDPSARLADLNRRMRELERKVGLLWDERARALPENARVAEPGPQPSAGEDASENR